MLLGLAVALVGTGIVNAKEPLYDGLGSDTRTSPPIPQAQRYFNQGLAFLHGFNHGAAIRSFQEAAKSRPEMRDDALGHRPRASVRTSITRLVPPPAAELAWKELTLAQQHADKASPVERALIEALSHRYANPQPEDRAPLDKAYADAMREVWKEYPNDVHVGVFFAEVDDGPRAVESMDARRSAKSGHGRNPRDARRRVEAESEASVCESSLHPRGRGLAASRARERGRRSTAKAATGARAQRAHAVAHRHPPRPVAESDRDQRKAIEDDRRYRQNSPTNPPV